MAEWAGGREAGRGPTRPRSRPRGSWANRSRNWRPGRRKRDRVGRRRSVRRLSLRTGNPALELGPQPAFPDRGPQWWLRAGCPARGRRRSAPEAPGRRHCQPRSPSDSRRDHHASSGELTPHAAEQLLLRGAIDDCRHRPGELPGVRGRPQKIGRPSPPRAAPACSAPPAWPPWSCPGRPPPGIPCVPGMREESSASRSHVFRGRRRATGVRT